MNTPSGTNAPIGLYLHTPCRLRVACWSADRPGGRAQIRPLWVPWPRLIWVLWLRLLPVAPPGCGGRPAAATARRWPASVQAQAVGDRSGLDPAVGAQFGEDVGDVDAGGLGADEQCLGDLAVAAPRRD